MRCIRERSTATETLSRTMTWGDQGRQLTNGAGTRSAWASGQAYSFYDSEWQDHWWLEPETWGSGGTYENATYDEYNYEYQWRRTWVPEGEPEVTESATNGVLGLENGAGTGWWSWCSAGGSSSSTSWSGSWSSSYGTTVEYPGFFDGAYYGVDNCGVREEYFEYLGDALSDGLPGASGGMFPFAYSDEEPLFGQRQSGGGALDIAERTGQQQSVTLTHAETSSYAPELTTADANSSFGPRESEPNACGTLSPPEAAYFRYPPEMSIGYQGIGYMGNQTARPKIAAANRVLDEMRATLKQTIAHLSPEEQQRARQELETLISTAVSTPSYLGLRLGDCYKWANEVIG